MYDESDDAKKRTRAGGVGHQDTQFAQVFNTWRHGSAQKVGSPTSRASRRPRVTRSSMRDVLAYSSLCVPDGRSYVVIDTLEIVDFGTGMSFAPPVSGLGVGMNVRTAACCARHRFSVVVTYSVRLPNRPAARTTAILPQIPLVADRPRPVDSDA